MPTPTPSWQTLQQAADRAHNTADQETAVDLYTRALDAARADPADPWDSIVAISMDRANSLQRLGAFAAADTTLSALADEAAGRGDEATVVAALADLATMVLRRAGELRRGLEVAERGLAAARRTGQPGSLALALTALAVLQMNLGRNQESQENLAEAFTYMGPEHSQTRMKALFTQVGALANTGRQQEALSVADEALQVARSVGDREWEGLCLNLVAINTYDLARARSLIEEALAAFEAAGSRPAQALILCNSSSLWLNLGLPQRACDSASRSLAMSRAMALTSLCVYDLQFLGFAAFYSGDLQAAISHLSEGLALADHVGLSNMQFVLNLYLGAARSLLGEQSVADEALKATASLRYDQRPADTANLLAYQAAASLLAGDRPGARRIARRALAIIEKELGSLTSEVPIDEICWWCYRALAPDREAITGRGHISAAAWRALELGLKAMLVPIENLSDAGLRRGYLHRVDFRRLLIRAWLRHGPAHGVGPEALAAFTSQVQKPGRLDDIFRRLTEVGVRLNAQRDPSRLPQEIVDEVAELTGAERIALVLLDEQGNRRAARTVLPRLSHPAWSAVAVPPPDEGAFLAEIEPWLQQAAASRQGFIRIHQPGRRPGGAAQHSGRPSAQPGAARRRLVLRHYRLLRPLRPRGPGPAGRAGQPGRRGGGERRLVGHPGETGGRAHRASSRPPTAAWSSAPPS